MVFNGYMIIYFKVLPNKMMAKKTKVDIERDMDPFSSDPLGAIDIIQVEQKPLHLLFHLHQNARGSEEVCITDLRK